MAFLQRRQHRATDAERHDNQQRTHEKAAAQSVKQRPQRRRGKVEHQMQPVANLAKSRSARLARQQSKTPAKLAALEDTPLENQRKPIGTRESFRRCPGVRRMTERDSSFRVSPSVLSTSRRLNGRPYPTNFSSVRAETIARPVSWLTGTSGSLTFGLKLVRKSESAYLTGAGFGSRRSARNNGSNRI